MRVLLIHQVFVMPSEAGGTRHYELARHWVRAGHRFTVVAGNVNYLTGTAAEGEMGEVSAGESGGIEVIRTRVYAARQKSFGLRVVSFCSFMVTSAWAGLRAGRVDVVMGTSPPIFQGVSAWCVAAARRRPFLLEVRDLWPEFAIGMGVLKNRVVIGLSRWLEAFLYARADHILVNSPAYGDYLVGRGIPASKVSVIANGADPDMFDPEAEGESIREECALGKRFVVTYAGALGAANDIPTLLRAAGRLRDRTEIVFFLVGDGKERLRLERLAEEMRLSNMVFAGARSKRAMGGILAASDVCVALLQAVPMFRTTYPNKVFDYMAAGRPTILAIDGVIRELMERSGGGIYVTPGDDAELAEAVLRLEADRGLARRMGRAARQYVAEHFNRRRQGAAFVRLLERWVGGGQAGEAERGPVGSRSGN